MSLDTFFFLPLVTRHLTLYDSGMSDDFTGDKKAPMKSPLAKIERKFIDEQTRSQYDTRLSKLNAAASSVSALESQLELALIPAWVLGRSARRAARGVLTKV